MGRALPRLREGRGGDLLPWAWSLILGLVVLGPALGPGFVLSYDMVWVPDLALRPSFWGLGSGLPRAVPSDAVVAILDEVIPGALLQDVLLLGALVGAGAGAAGLVANASMAGRLAAAAVYVWNPFVAERLVIGHWPVLLGYAVLPWLVVAGRRARQQARVPLRMGLLVPLGSLSAGAGLVTALVVAAFALPLRRRSALLLGALVAAANAPWVVAGLVHAPTAVTSAAGARVFALSDVGVLPGPVAALGLGGIWNAEVVLPSRETWLAVAWVCAVAVLALLGAPRLRREWPGRDVVALVGCWSLGWGLAVLTWAAPGQVGWLVGSLPGAGLLRDGARFLALCAPLLAALVGSGVARAAALAPAGAPRVVLSAGLVLVPVAALPDAAFGASGRLAEVRYPDEYAEAARAVQAGRDAGQQGDALLLPFASYRAPAFTGGRKVLDPMGRFLPIDYLADDTLVVSGTTVLGEDPRAAAAARLVADAGPGSSATAPERPLAERDLAALGIGFVVRDDPLVTVRRLDDVRPRAAPTSWVAALTLAWAAFWLVPGVAVAGLVRRRIWK